MRVSGWLRRRLTEMAARVWDTGKRCEVTPSGREVAPHQSTLLEAAWEVAARHPGELQTAIMKRTEGRSETGSLSALVAKRARPR